jgi:hypothetical protein
MRHNQIIPRQPPPGRSPLPAASIPIFFDIVEKALALHIKAEGTPDGTRPKFVREFPKERIAKPDQVFDVITAKVVSSEMAPTLNDGTKPRAPVQRQSKPNPELGGYNEVVYGWWELVNVQFMVWSKSSRNADLIGDWFHAFMMRYAFAYHFYQARGIQLFRFVKRWDDEVDHSFGQEVYTRIIQYEFKLETLMKFDHKQLTNLDITYGIKNPDGKSNQVDSISIIADPIPKGE